MAEFLAMINKARKDPDPGTRFKVRVTNAKMKINESLDTRNKDSHILPHIGKEGFHSLTKGLAHLQSVQVNRCKNSKLG